MSNPALVVPTVTAFPPSFAGDEWAFGWALFSLTAISTFSLSVMLQELRDARVQHDRLHEPLGVARAALCCLLLTIFMGSAGDVAFLYAWGEVSPATMRTILLVDRSLDATCFLPFAGFAFLFTRGRHVIVFQLTKHPLPADLWPTWEMVRRQVVAAALVLCIAAGVTLAK